MGVITFQFIDTPPLLDVHVFTTSNYIGTPVETEGINIVRGRVRYTVVCILYTDTPVETEGINIVRGRVTAMHMY